MANTLRGSQSLWDGVASSGVAGVSTAGYLGSLSQVTVFMWNTDVAVTTTVTAQVGEGQGTAGRNNTPTNWFDLYNGESGGLFQWSLAPGDKIAVNYPNLAATYLRLKSSADVILYASFETSD